MPERTRPLSPGPAHSARRRRSRDHRTRRRVIRGLAALVVALLAASAEPMVLPGSPRVRRAGALLSLDGPDETAREATVLHLLRRDRVPVLLFSQGGGRVTPCPSVPGVEVVCFDPHPARTVGEISFARRWARRHHPGELVVVAGLTQTFRARLLVAACYRGPAVVEPSPLPWYDVPYEVLYEWGALLKAFTWAPGC